MLCFLKMLPADSWIAEPYEAMRRCLIQMYPLSDFQKCQVLQSYCPTSDPKNWWTKCWSFEQKMRNQGFSSKDCSWNVFQLIFVRTYSLSLSVILKKWPSVLTSCGQSVVVMFLFKLYLIISLRMYMLFHSGTLRQGQDPKVLCWGLLVVVQCWKMRVEQVPFQFTGITADGEMKLTSVELSVPSWETS